MTVTLRPFQADLKREIYARWQRGVRNVLAVLPTGAGKTVTFSSILHEYPGASVAIAHRQELVSQISLALARNGVRHRIIGPKAVARACSAIHVGELRRTYVDPTARCAVAGVDTLIRMDGKDPWFAQVGLWVSDECFPAGTLVDGRPIESIKVGDMVSAYDESDGALKIRKVNHVFKNKKPKHMVRLQSTHHVLDCTLNHPVYTKRGWVPAVNLTICDEVLCHEMHELQQHDNSDKRSATLSLSKNRENLLHQALRDFASRIEANLRLDAEAEIVGKSTNTVSYLCETSDTKRSFDEILQNNGSSVLQSRMLDRISSEDIIRDCEQNKPKIRFATYETKKSDAQRSICRKDVCDPKINWAQTDSTGWKWSATVRRRIDAAYLIFRTWFRNATKHSNRAKDVERRNNSASLQTRSRELETEISNRSRRSEPWFTESQRSRQEKRSGLEWAGLDCVEIYESDDIGAPRSSGDDGYVYNLEVDDLNTYVANGIVVHNCHHLLTDNKWGQATRMFPNAYGLGVTATPCRADGYGLGRHADGLMDEMIVGPSMRDLIEQGFLTEYRIFAPPSDINMSQVTISAGGDYSPPKLAAAVHGSHIVGDVVAHYLRIAPGKLGVTFAVDVAAASEQAAAFRQAGVPSEVVSAKTPDALRVNILRRFASGEIKQLCNCDLFGEGFDLPAIEVVSMARPTASFSLYTQQFGRSMRIMEGKSHAIVIDHVGNVHRHGLPDAPRVWTLDRRERRSRSTPDDVVKVRTCPECTGTYERVLGLTCPFCGHTVEPIGRSGPECVDGDLSEMTPEALALLRGEIDKAPTFPYGAAPEVVGAIKKRHREKAEAQAALREAMAKWGGIRTAAGDDIATAQRRFYISYGIDVATAQTLGRAEAEELRGRIGL